MENDLATLIKDFEAFLAQPSFLGGVQVVEDATHLLKDIMGAQPNEVTRAKALKFAAPADAKALLAALKAEQAKGAIDWAKVIKIVLAIIQIVGPLILS